MIGLRASTVVVVVIQITFIKRDQGGNQKCDWSRWFESDRILEVDTCHLDGVFFAVSNRPLCLDIDDRWSNEPGRRRRHIAVGNLEKNVKRMAAVRWSVEGDYDDSRRVVAP